MRVNLVNLPSSLIFKVLSGLFVVSALVAVLASAGAPIVPHPHPVLALACIVLDAALLAAFVLLVLYEQIQDRILFRRWKRERESSVALRHGLYRECPGCGFARNRDYDRSCLNCGRPVHVSIDDSDPRHQRSCGS